MSTHEKEKQDSLGETHVDEIHAQTDTVFTEDALDPVYQAKARILNDAIQEIGMGKYQWCVQPSLSGSQLIPISSDRWLFAVTGFGWLA